MSPWTALGEVMILGFFGDLLFGRRAGLRLMFRRLWRTAYVAVTVLDFAQHDWIFGCIGAACIAAWFWEWWRKNRRKVAALLGAKSRALRDAIVKRAREAGTPRPVLRPVPVQR